MDVTSPVQQLLYSQEMADEVLKLKEEGNALFQKGDYKNALSVYSKAIEACKVPDLLRTLLSNRAACHLQLNQLDVSS
jgi:tetratricopeptide (TPR) repeat protein